MKHSKPKKSDHPNFKHDRAASDIVQKTMASMHRSKKNCKGMNKE